MMIITLITVTSIFQRTNKLIEPTVQWYHQVTGHPGRKRLYEHVRQR